MEFVDLPSELRILLWTYLNPAEVLRMRLTCKQINSEILQNYGIPSAIKVKDDMAPHLLQFLGRVALLKIEVPEKQLLGERLAFSQLISQPDRLEQVRVLGRVSYPFLQQLLEKCANLISVHLEGAIIISGQMNSRQVDERIIITLENLKHLTCIATSSPSNFLVSSILVPIEAPHLSELCLRLFLSGAAAGPGGSSPENDLYQVTLSLITFLGRCPNLKVLSLRFYDQRMDTARNLLYMSSLPTIRLGNAFRQERIAAQLSELGTNKVSLLGVKIGGSDLINLTFWPSFLKTQTHLVRLSIEGGDQEWQAAVDIVTLSSSTLVAISLGASFSIGSSGAGAGSTMSFHVFSTCENLEELMVIQKSNRRTTFLSDVTRLSGLVKLRQLDVFGTSVHMSAEDYAGCLDFPPEWIVCVMCYVNGSFVILKRNLPVSTVPLRPGDD